VRPDSQRSVDPGSLHQLRAADVEELERAAAERKEWAAAFGSRGDIAPVCAEAASKPNHAGSRGSWSFLHRLLDRASPCGKPGVVD